MNWYSLGIALWTLLLATGAAAGAGSADRGNLEQVFWVHQVESDPGVPFRGFASLSLECRSTVAEHNRAFSVDRFSLKWVGGDFNPSERVFYTFSSGGLFVASGAAILGASQGIVFPGEHNVALDLQTNAIPTVVQGISLSFFLENQDPSLHQVQATATGSRPSDCSVVLQIQTFDTPPPGAG